MAKENPLSGRKPVHRWVAAATRLLPSGLLAGGAAPRPSGAAMSVVVGPGRKVTSVLSELLEAIPKGGMLCRVRFTIGLCHTRPLSVRR